MTVMEAIKKYEISPVAYGPNAGKVMIRRPPEDAVEKAVLMKLIPGIKLYFSEKKSIEEAESARRKANVASIPGLKEIEALREAVADWNYKFEKSFDDCGGLGVGPKPKGDEKALLEQYPEAAAYLRVKQEAQSSNYRLSGIGRKALERFEDAPENWKQIVADMDKEIKAFIDEHAWD